MECKGERSPLKGRLLSYCSWSREPDITIMRQVFWLVLYVGAFPSDNQTVAFMPTTFCELTAAGTAPEFAPVGHHRIPF